MERFWESRVGFKKLKKKGGGMITNQDYLKNLVRELTKLPYETENAGLIKIVDKNTAPRYMKYIPFWG